METENVITSAIEEICLRDANGLSLSSLWSVLTPTPDVYLKPSIWTQLLSIPSLQFIVPGNYTPLSPTEPKIQRFEDAEKLKLKIVSNEHLRDCVLGVYENPSTGLLPGQRDILRRLAAARTKGMTQDQLAKEFGIEGRNFFYRVRNLESRGLIVRQKVNVKKNQADNSLNVHTNMIYLSRYAKQLGVQQTLEIRMEERNSGDHGNLEQADVGEDGLEGETVEDDVQVKDFLPAMKAICGKLEAADNKVLVVSDIKQVLGYTGPSGHRSWRSVCDRLIKACVVEECATSVNGKVLPCLRLLKTLGCGYECQRVKTFKFGRRFQQTEQLVELPIDHQIYDMINAKEKGAKIIELCQRLGLDRKRNDSRLHNLVSRFGMQLKRENFNKTQVFRVMPAENYNPEEPNPFLDKSKIVPGGNNISTFLAANDDVRDRSTEALIKYNHSTFDVDFAASGKPSNGEVHAELCHGFPVDGQANPESHISHKGSEFLHEQTNTSSNAKLDLVTVETRTKAGSSKTTSSKLPNSGSYQTHPNPSLSTDAALREQRILELLQNEKFLLKKELHRWLVSLERDKRTVMDRRTVYRILNKLQQEGHCKCVEIYLPGVTNCTKRHPEIVVLHPSIQNFPPELMEKIHERLRLFEKEIRVQAMSKLKSNESIPVLNGVVRTQIDRGSNEQAVKAEAMRANGFVMAKMIRAKLIHNFLWDYMSSSPGWDDILSAGSCKRSCRSFSLEEAIKNLPLELFLQVVGSTKNIDHMTEKCKIGLCLTDLPVEEYNHLMDTHAIGRLSLIIDILQRLKLIRLIRKGHLENGVKIPHETFMRAMELRPYIEEPLPVVATSNLRSLDLRPRIRHDFILSNREAVDEYWKTLEYCYAAADPRAAVCAFPGSTVPEVFHPHFWTSLRKMSSHQRDELLKRITEDDLSRRLSLEQCVNIAGDLDLTLQQVLRAYYKHQRDLNIFQGTMNANEDQALKKKLPSRKRKRSLDSSSLKHGRVNEQLDEQGLMRLPDADEQFMEEPEVSTSGHHHDHLPANFVDDCLEYAEEPESNRDKKQQSVISQYTLSKSPAMRHRRFSWTDADDRQLLMQYARHRAVLGANIHRVDWNQLPGLPASPSRCRRRISFLKRNEQFRKALMKLCTMLSKRFTKHLAKTQRVSVDNNDCGVLARCSTSEGVVKFSNSVENVENVKDVSFEEEQWDDFKDRSIKNAFEGVLLCKTTNFVEPALVSSSTIDENIHKDGQGIHKDSAQRKRRHHPHQKFIKCFSKGTFFGTQVHKSLAVSNAVELLKLVFLSTSAKPELQNHLGETLRRYSEQDLFAAFSYLREKKIMIGGDGDQPFVLSQQFLQSISKSSFPSNTGKKAAKFSDWLLEREKDLMEGGISLTADLQSGDIFQLFALVFTGELSISPCVPNEGVGEAEDLRSLKRKAEDDELCDGDKSKKMKSLADAELISRREKGFPGITVLLHRAKIMAVNAVEMFRDLGTCISEFHQNDKFKDALGQKISSSSSQCDTTLETPNFNSVVPAAGWTSESPWESMEGYAMHLMMKPADSKLSIVNSEVFRTVFMAIQKAGDQGLSLEEVSQVVGENLHERIIDVLQAFGYALKVNAFDSIRFVDALYRSKFFLTSFKDFHQNLDQHSMTKSLQRSSDGQPLSHSESRDTVGSTSDKEATISNHQVHKVTILNLPGDKVILPEQNNDGEARKVSSDELCVPILPWINGNGSINKVVYDGLIRRVLGMVMQNPGMLEDNIIHQMDALNPQSCRTLLEFMILDKHLTVRNMHESTSSGPPALLGSLLGSSFKESKSLYRKHFFANPMSASML